MDIHPLMSETYRNCSLLMDWDATAEQASAIEANTLKRNQKEVRK